MVDSARATRRRGVCEARASKPPEGQCGTFRPKTSNNPLDVDIVGIDLFMGIRKARLVIRVTPDQKVSHNNSMALLHMSSPAHPALRHLHVCIFILSVNVVIVRVNVIA
jgi:hypothetical protein